MLACMRSLYSHFMHVNEYKAQSKLVHSRLNVSILQFNLPLDVLRKEIDELHVVIQHN